MSVHSMLKRPDVFKVGVAWSAMTGYESAWWGEWTLGEISENKEVFQRTSNVALANRLRGRLLLMHGTSDKAVLFSNAMKLTHS